jgi:hypothetical protein
MQVNYNFAKYLHTSPTSFISETMQKDARNLLSPKNLPNTTNSFTVIPRIQKLQEYVTGILFPYETFKTSWQYELDTSHDSSLNFISSAKDGVKFI